MNTTDALPRTPGRLRGRAALAALAVAGLVVAGLGIERLVRSSDATTTEPASAATASADAGVEGTDAVGTLEAKVAADPDDAAAFAALGVAYVDRARSAADPSDYPRAEAALARSLAVQPDGNWQALAGQAALAAGRHDFAPAAALANEALALAPRNSFILGVLVDALTELGRYDEAAAATQEMVDARPNLGAYARVSYQRELRGDLDGASEAMALALQAAGSDGDRAFAHYFLGQIAWLGGDLEAATRHFDDTLRVDPEATNATAGLARIAAARGDLDRATALARQATDAAPDPEALKDLGDLYTARSKPAEADAAYARADAANRRQNAGGVYVDLEIALFSADRGVDLDRGLAAAQAEWGRRQSVHVADALAWQLHANGRSAEALPYADKALALGTPNAAFHFHRAEIHRALGNGAEAIADYRAALALNPHFSVLHAPVAKAQLEALEG